MKINTVIEELRYMKVLKIGVSICDMRVQQDAYQTESSIISNIRKMDNMDHATR